MTDLNDIVNLFGQQNDLSGLQQWQKQGGTAADPDYTALAQLAPRTYKEMLPQILLQQQQMAGLGMTPGSSQPSALAQYGSSGDQSPDASIPQGLPSQSLQPAQQSQQAPQQSGLAQLQQAYKIGGRNVEQGLKILQAQKALQIPAGVGPIPQGQQYVNGKLQNIPGAMTPGQVDRDKDFADIYTPFKNTGGEASAKSQLDGIQNVIDGLKNGDIHTGDIQDRFAMDNEGGPSEIGRLADPQLLYANNQVMKAVLPSSKALFGARVTQREVAMNIMANGFNPYATPEQNIANLTTLKNNLATAQKSTAQAGEYFDKNGTLAGYEGHVPGIDPAATPLNPQGATNQPNPQLLETLKKRGLLK